MPKFPFTIAGEAKKLLRRRLAEKDEGKLAITNQHKVKFDDLVELLLLDHEVNGRDRIEAQQHYQAYLAEQQRAAVAVLAREQSLNSDKIRLIR